MAFIRWLTAVFTYYASELRHYARHLSSLARREHQHIQPRPEVLGLEQSSCMTCGRQRAGALIAVTRLPIEGLEGSFPDTRCNYRHCVDDRLCYPPPNTIWLRDGGLRVPGGPSPS